MAPFQPVCPHPGGACHVHVSYSCRQPPLLSSLAVKRVTLDPVRFRLLRLLRFRIRVQLAQRAGQPVPVMTPELEAIGVMTDMLSLMYRYSVDTLGSVISPITSASFRP